MKAQLRRWAKALKQQTFVVYYAARDPRTPWLVRLLALGVAAYAFSPIDLIPDFIPVLGYLDDLILVPLGVMLVLRLLPDAVRTEAKLKADAAAERPTSAVMATVIVALWILAIAAVGIWAWRATRI